MFKRLFALVSTSFITYVTAFTATVSAAIIVTRGGSMGEAIGIVARGIPFLLTAGAIGGLVVSCVAVVKRKTIARSTVGRWLGVVAGAGVAHVGLLAAAGLSGVVVTGLLGATALAVVPPLVAGTLMFQRRALGVARAPAIQAPE